MKKQYFLGLDLGTNSLGFAVTDQQYEVLKFHQKAMIGIRLFEEAKTAAKRRAQRAANRRNLRRVQRNKLLQDFFSEAICQVDPGFYQRLKDSFFLPEDKKIFQKNTLFNDLHYNDSDYHRQYPTIYHLRHDLMKNEQAHDVRLVYLACSHYLNNRGHFLYSGESFDLSGQYEILFSEFKQVLEDHFEINLQMKHATLFLEILKDSRTKKAEKIEALLPIFDQETDPKLIKAIITLFLGGKVKFTTLFGEELDGLSPDGLSFSGSGFEDEKAEDIQNILSEDQFSALSSFYALYNFIQLQTILKGSDSFSEAKIRVYDKHHQDLKRLKPIMKSLLTKKAYFEFFNKTQEKMNNYVAYTGHCSQKGKKVMVNYRCDQSLFLENLAKILKSLTAQDTSQAELIQEILAEIENKTFLPKGITKDNGTVPNQLQAAELKQILENASKYLPFLSESHEDGFTTAEMILQLMKFRIPYYIGPLNPSHSVKEGSEDGSQHAWIVKKEDQPVRPWNFSKVVDEAKSAERFIKRMTNKCTYLIGEDVLPKESPSYSKFAILNLLNVIEVDGKRLSADLKQQIFMEFFLSNKRKKANRKNILEFLRLNGYPQIVDKQLTGIDFEVPGNMRGLLDIEKAVPEKLNLSEKEEIVLLATILPDSGSLLKQKLKDIFGRRLSEEEIIRLSRLKFTGWGKLSWKFLNGLKTPCNDGTNHSILEMMWTTNQNLNELLGAGYLFSEAIKNANATMLGQDRNMSYQLVRDYPCSPSVKKMIWQTLKVTKELVKINGCPPQKIFIEVAREEGEKKRTSSRKQQLLDLYKSCGKDMRAWAEKVDKLTEIELRKNKLFFYYIQMGKCMYTGEQIDINLLFSRDNYGHDYYDIDHIFPRSKTKDDSVLNNLVLVKSTINREKGDVYPLSTSIQSRMYPFWSQLRDQKMLTDEKFRRLTRKEKLSTEELAAFINRQLVETRQATKAVADIFKQVFPETRIVYVKAGVVTDFRYKQREFSFPKTRGMNDLHHAKDAYLNIVVGNVWDCRFTQNPLHYFRNNPGQSYNLSKIYETDVKDPQTGLLAWQAGEQGTLLTVSTVLSRNNILFTRQTYHQTSGGNGGLFDQNLMPKGRGQFPIKASDARLAGKKGIDKYGGFNKETGYGFFIVDYTEKKKVIRSIEPLPLTWVAAHGQSEESLQGYCLERLGIKDPQIIIKDIPYQSLLKIDGFPFRLIAKSGKTLKLAPALQPIFAKDLEKVIHQVQKSKEQGREKDEEVYGLPDPEEASRLYDAIYKKLHEKPYERVSAFRKQADNMKKAKENFMLLNAREQAKVLRELIMLFQCNGTRSDLSLLQAKDENGNPSKTNAQSGMLTINQSVNPNLSLELVHQSPSGLFENVVDLNRR